MKFQTFIKTNSLIAFFFSICLSSDTPFISMAGDCRYPSVVSEGKHVYLTWLVSEGRGALVYFKYSKNEGEEWTTEQRISNENAACYPSALAVHSGIVHLAWVDFGETIDGELYYNRSLDGGETWEKNYILVKDANSARYPLLACYENHVYLIWQDVENKTFFKASHDNGRNWEPEILLAKLGRHSCYCYPPALTVNGDEISVVWTDVRENKKGLNITFFGLPVPVGGTNVISAVVRKKSTDAGNTWSKEQIITKTEVTKEAKDEIDNPLMISDEPHYYLFWLDRRNNKMGDIFYDKFNPKVTKLPITGKVLYPGQKRSPKRPAAVFDEARNFHLSWASFFGGNSIVYYGQSDSTGVVLKEQKALTADTGRYHNPVIARTPSGLLQIFWFNEPKNEWSKIFLKTSRDNGLTWVDWKPFKVE